MNVNDMMKLITEAQRDAIWNTPDGSMLEDAPEDVYRDLACRFVWELQKRKLMIAPAIDVGPWRAAARIFEILTKWLIDHPGRSYDTGRALTGGRFEVILIESGKTQGFFQGGSVQDAYAQAAQTISINEEGELDERTED